MVVLQLELEKPPLRNMLSTPVSDEDYLLRRYRSVILEDLRTSRPDNSVVLYHCFDSDRPKESLKDAIQDLVFQAVTEARTLPPLAVELYKKKGHSNTDLPQKDLTDVLTAVIRSSEKAYVVLDGLDECTYSSKVVRLLPTLTGAGMKVLVTSRDLPDIRKHFENGPSLEARAPDDDMHRYIAWRLEEDAEVDYEYFGKQTKEDMIAKLINHVDGS